jgi:hypothetical protein
MCFVTEMPKFEIKLLPQSYNRKRAQTALSENLLLSIN